MKVLWFEVTEPSGYKDRGEVIGGWQDSLEAILKTTPGIELFVAFASDSEGGAVKVGNVTYLPLRSSLSKWNKIRLFYSCRPETMVLLPQATALVEEIKPDIIHVFGLEWCWGLIANYVKVPVVIHIMGSMVPYYNALYPPKYSLFTLFKCLFPGIRDVIWALCFEKLQKTRLIQEKRIWKSVCLYMGRTCWDEALSFVMNPQRRYFHVDEALRPTFMDNDLKWTPPSQKFRLVSTGSKTFWKGPDMMLKTAGILKSVGLNFEWIVIGGMKSSIKKVVEKTEQSTFEENNIKLLGYLQANEIKEILLNSSIYVHTAYIENSPNSICEAQIVGIPVVSTNVGGISQFVENNEDGILVPANDPWQMAYAIISLLNDDEKAMTFSRKAREKALKRHNTQKIREELMRCYKNAIMDKNQ